MEKLKPYYHFYIHIHIHDSIVQRGRGNDLLSVEQTTFSNIAPKKQRINLFFFFYTHRVQSTEKCFDFYVHTKNAKLRPEFYLYLKSQRRKFRRFLDG